MGSMVAGSTLCGVEKGKGMCKFILKSSPLVSKQWLDSAA